MQSGIQLTTWRRWREALWFGLPLALLELGLFGIAIATTSRLSPPQAIAPGLLLYFFIAGAARYAFNVREHRSEREDVWVGFRVGMVGFAIVMAATTLIFAVLYLRYIQSPPPFSPSVPHRGGLYDPEGERQILASSWGLFAAFNSCGVLLSALGERLGSVLAGWRARNAGASQA